MLDERLMIAGPVVSVLGVARTCSRSVKAFLALGLTCGAINLIGEHDSPRSRELRARFEQQFNRLRGEVLDHCNPTVAPTHRLPRAFAAPATNSRCARHTPPSRCTKAPRCWPITRPSASRARRCSSSSGPCPDPVIDCTVSLLSAG
jgi:hypothetical protein